MSLSDLLMRNIPLTLFLTSLFGISGLIWIARFKHDVSERED